MGLRKREKAVQGGDDVHGGITAKEERETLSHGPRLITLLRRLQLAVRGRSRFGRERSLRSFLLNLIISAMGVTRGGHWYP